MEKIPEGIDNVSENEERKNLFHSANFLVNDEGWDIGKSMRLPPNIPSDTGRVFLSGKTHETRNRFFELDPKFEGIKRVYFSYNYSSGEVFYGSIDFLDVKNGEVIFKTDLDSEDKEKIIDSIIKQTLADYRGENINSTKKNPDEHIHITSTPMDVITNIVVNKKKNHRVDSITMNGATIDKKRG